MIYGTCINCGRIAELTGTGDCRKCVGVEANRIRMERSDEHEPTEADMKKAHKCIHYNGTVNDCCDAGVNYQQLAGPGKAWGKRLPCHGPEYRLASGTALPRADVVVTCEKRQEPTPEEIEDDEAQHFDRFSKMMVCREAIVAHLGGKWKKGMAGSAGAIDCPSCKGEKTLRFTRSGYNGHIHAGCKTGGCVSWME